MVFAGFAIFQINRRNVAFLIVQFGPDDGLAGRKGFGHVKDALVSGTAELQQRVFLVFEIATVDKDVDKVQQFEFVWGFTRPHEFFPRVAGPCPDIFGMTEFLANALCERY